MREQVEQQHDVRIVTAGNEEREVPAVELVRTDGDGARRCSRWRRWRSPIGRSTC